MGYANFVIDSEKKLAIRIDQYSDDDRNTHDFVAGAIDGRITVRDQYQDDSVGIEGLFTPRTRIWQTSLLDKRPSSLLL